MLMAVPCSLRQFLPLNARMLGNDIKVFSVLISVLTGCFSFISLLISLLNGIMRQSTTPKKTGYFF